LLKFNAHYCKKNHKGILGKASWFRGSSGRRWYNQNQLKDHFGHVRILGANRIIFNICGNKYRLIVEVNYPRGWFFIRFIGTHTEYDRIDPKTI
jgi:mRNA interferase HigB